MIGGHHIGRKVSLSEYIDRKISMLEDEFFIKLGLSDIIGLRNLKSEADVDAFAHRILVERL